MTIWEWVLRGGVMGDTTLRVTDNLKLANEPPLPYSVDTKISCICTSKKRERVALECWRPLGSRQGVGCGHL